VRVDIECSADGGHTWSAVAKGLRNLSSYAWNTASVANGTYFLRLSADNGQGSTTVLSEPFTVENAQRNAPVISLLTPSEPEVWWGVREVRWYAWDADGDRLSITLAYSLDQGQSWAVFATGVPATVSDGLFRSDDVGEVALAVRNPRAPTVVLLSPRGGEHWRGRQQIIWAVAPAASTTRVNLDYSADAGRTWRSLASGLGAQESYWWDTTTLAASARGGWWGTASVLLRVTASDGVQSGTAVLTQPLVIHGDASWFMPPLVLP
jgi:hypothetical protein